MAAEKMVVWALNFDSLPLSEYHSYIKFKTTIRISKKFSFENRMQENILNLYELL